MAAEPSFFSERLRVLLLDDDPVCRKITARMLHRCNYDMVEISKATDALKILEKNPKEFDLIISDVYNDVDILPLLARISNISGDLPVVLITGVEKTSILIPCVVHDADEIISKPVSLTKIKTLWQHVYRKRMQKKNEPNDHLRDDGERRRKKARVQWQGELQEKFTDAVERLGGPDKAVPQKILELMNVPDISRESVASHLQKCRKRKKPAADRNDRNSPVVSSSSLTLPLSSMFSSYNNPFMPRFRYHVPPPPLLPAVGAQPLPPPVGVAAQALAAVSVDDVDLSWLNEVLDYNAFSSHINGNV